MDLKRFRKGVVLAAFLAFLLALLALSLSSSYDQALLTYSWEIKWPGILLVFLFHSLAQACLFIAWRRILALFGNKSAWQHDFFVYNLSILARRIPLPIWYLGTRIYFHKSEQPSAGPPLVLAASAIELLFILFSGAIFFVMLAPWYQFEWLQKTILYIAAIISTPILFLMISMVKPGIGARFINWGMRHFHPNWSPVFLRRQDYVILVSAYISVWFLDGLGFYSMVWSLTTSDSVSFAISIVGVSTITALTGIATLFFPFGFAIKEISATLLLMNWFPAIVSLAIVIAYRILHIFIELIWVIVGAAINKIFCSTFRTVNMRIPNGV